VPYTVVFLWLSGTTTPPRVALDDLYDYGAARGASFVPLSALPLGPAAQNRARALPAYDAERVDRLEAELEQARTALSTLEEQAATERLERIKTELLAHPHLPQAAFLLAECLTLEAQAAGAGALSSELRLQSLVLAGPRAPAFGEALGANHEPAPRSVAVEGLAASDELEVDGQPRGARRLLTLLPGLHHVRVLRGGRLIYAAFEQLAAEQQPLTLAVPPVRACSYDDLAGVDRAVAARGARLANAVQCQHWALVRPEPGGVGIANCGREQCGPFVHWQRRPAPAPFTPLVVDRSSLPSWAGFAIAGAGAALATSFVLWQSGALDRGARAAGTLEYHGLNPQR
jgi:hypothetical protein